MSEIDRYVNGLEISVEEFKSSILVDKKILANPAGGNCLFHALSYLLKKQFPKQAESITNKRIRKDICDYYEKKFRNGTSANPESAALAALSKGSELERQLFRLYTFGSPADAAGNFILEDHYVDHQLEVCKKGVWGEEVDILVACIIYNVNIVVFSLLPPSNYSKQPIYHILTYKNRSDLPTFYLHLRMDGESSHYEAMYSKSTHQQKIPSFSKTEKAKSKAKSLSSEKRTTRKGKHQAVLDKLFRFYEKIDQFIPSKNKADIERDFSDIQLKVVTMISALETLSSRSSELSLPSSPDEKKMEELASLKAMLSIVSKSDKAKILTRIEELEA